jgi:hypothetical protein
MSAANGLTLVFVSLAKVNLTEKAIWQVLFVLMIQNYIFEPINLGFPHQNAFRTVSVRNVFSVDKFFQ